MELRPCMGQDVSLGEEAVSVDSGQGSEHTCRSWAGERSGLFEHLD